MTGCAHRRKQTLRFAQFRLGNRFIFEGAHRLVQGQKRFRGNVFLMRVIRDISYFAGSNLLQITPILLYAIVAAGYSGNASRTRRIDDEGICHRAGRRGNGCRQ